MTGPSLLNLLSLKDQVYDYLRERMKKGELRPGAAINTDETSERLGISKTPLRDALIRLEVEGFVTILPRRGVIVNRLSLAEIKDFYQIIGALESTALLSAAPRMGVREVERMKRLNGRMRDALDGDNFELYYNHNLAMHNVYIDVCGNGTIRSTLDTLKKRLYDFPRSPDFIKEWEERSTEEHQTFIQLLSDGRFDEAALYMRDVHWSFEVQKPFLVKYYSIEEDHV
ncbi:MAG: GntR family transcriptional regulator [Acidobacteriota bacterium]